MKIAFRTGVTGQHGAGLSEFLLRKRYEFHGLKRLASLFDADSVDYLYQDPMLKTVTLFYITGI